MPTPRHKRIAKVKVTLTKRTIEALMPQARPWIAWDTDVTGFGVKVHPTGTKSFVLNYRARTGGRRARNRRVVIGDANWVAPDHARRRARELLDRVAVGEDPAEARTAARRLPTLAEAFEEYLEANPDRKEQTARFYRALMRNCFADWLARPLSIIARRDVEARFLQVSKRRGRTVGNHAISLLRSVYRRPCVDFDDLRNPVEQWLAGGGRYHRVVRRRISAPSEVLPRWRRGIESEVIVPATRDIFWCGLYTGLRVSEVFGLRWDRVSLSRRSCGSKRPRPGNRCSCQSPGSLRKSSSGGGRTVWTGPLETAPAPGRAAGCSPRRPAPPATWKSCSTCTGGSPGWRERSSGSTGSGTPSSASRSASSCCRARSPSGW